MSFKNCIPIILKHEGGYVNNPNDPGGETNFGISKRSFPEIDIKSLTPEKAADIYYHFYWLPMKLDKINDENIQLELFDFGVNAGKSRAIKKVQQLCKIKQDGIIGQQTIEAINIYPGNFLKDYKHARRVYYEYIANRNTKLKVFLKGWLKRVDNNILKT